MPVHILFYIFFARGNYKCNLVPDLSFSFRAHLQRHAIDRWIEIKKTHLLPNTISHVMRPLVAFLCFASCVNHSKPENRVFLVTNPSAHINHQHHNNISVSVTDINRSLWKTKMFATTSPCKADVKTLPGATAFMSCVILTV